MPEPHSRRHQLAMLVVAWAALLAIETLGQVSLKVAGARVGAFELDAAHILSALATPWLWVGLACYLGAFAVWMGILEKTALSTAFPITAITFVTVMIASWAILGEPMGRDKLLGSAIIVAGILLLGGDTDPATPAPARNDVEGNLP
jgi:drug/metabolite transporter (DMT)-like permease